MAFSRIARSSLRRSIGGNYSGDKGLSQSGTLNQYLRRTTHVCENAPVVNGSSLLSSIHMELFQSRGIRMTPHYKYSNALPEVEESDFDQLEREKLAGLEATKPGEKPRVVVLGTGWAACRFMKGINTNLYDVVCISPRNHMVFTPLLASTCVGTLEFRSVTEPVGRIQPSLATSPGSYFYLASCTDLDTEKHEVR